MIMNGPTAERQRHVILDLLRGLALLGIALANFPEFALWTFLSEEQQAALPTASLDRVVRYLQYLLVDGKFYTIFSLLFGIGFSLILAHHGRRLFLRRMLILVVIGFLHLMFIWSGDILLLYAVGGLLLTLIVKVSDRNLLVVALLLILVPVGLDALTEYRELDFARPFYERWWQVATSQGITEANFATWLRDAQSYPQMFAFLLQGACERMWEFVEGHRLPKVVGLFILGYLIGKRQLYARLPGLPLRHIALWSSLLGFPLSALYAWSATSDRPWGLTLHSLLYALSVVSLAAAYIAAVCLFYLRRPQAPVHRWLAAPGRMALTNYISQSLTGIFLFYGVGLGFGTSVGLIYVEAIALSVFLCQILLSRLWLRYFRFGLLEWIWRLLTYGHYFPLRRTATPSARQEG
ncbi:MAG: DUF418 domain-containing protein [Bacteroidaceae bacterium]|nr:DUF418 domain-containing protein [Bacteroidaceae bacterium]